MHVIRLLSTTGSGGATVGEMPFVIMGQPTAGHIVAKTIKLAEGVYSQMPTTEAVTNTYSGQGIYEGVILTYSSADGVRPESNIFRCCKWKLICIEGVSSSNGIWRYS